MKKLMITAACCAALPAMTAYSGVYGDVPDARHAWAVHDWNRPKPTKVQPAPYVKTGVPSDAIVLFDGTKKSLDANWCDKNGNPTQWKLGNEGDFYCLSNNRPRCGIQTRASFGDCQLHIEFRHEADITDQGKGPQMRGNSGVFLMGAGSGYEVQVLESYYTSREMQGKEGYVDNYADGQAGAVYAENPPLVNPQRKPGEWQTYDIVFHQPLWDGLKLVHPGSITVFFNGVLVQDNWQMEGLTTHANRRPLAPTPTAGPLALQDHGCTVHYRNIWYRPLASRWSNTTHSELTANENDVMRQRRETAAALLAKIENRDAVTTANVLRLGEVISYANEGVYRAAWQKVASAYLAQIDKQSSEDRAKVAQMLRKLVKGNVLKDTEPLVKRLVLK